MLGSNNNRLVYPGKVAIEPTDSFLSEYRPAGRDVSSKSLSKVNLSPWAKLVLREQPPGRKSVTPPTAVSLPHRTAGRRTFGIPLHGIKNERYSLEGLPAHNILPPFFSAR